MEIYKTVIIYPNPPPPQDTPPPWEWGSFPSQNYQQTYVTYNSNSITLPLTDTSWQLCSSLQQHLSSSEVEMTVHDAFSENGKKRVGALCLSMHYH